jgi:hypothetical protein
MGIEQNSLIQSLENETFIIDLNPCLLFKGVFAGAARNKTE